MYTRPKIAVGLVGISGYAGMELVRLLTMHPSMELVQATSRAEAGKTLEELYPFMRNLPNARLRISQGCSPELARTCSLVFLAVPHGAGMDLGAELLHNSCKVVDLSADFRLRQVTLYEEWYKTRHTQAALLDTAVYGLPELYETAIKKSRLTANPGCYPTAAILALFPALKHRLISPEDIVIDAKSGTSGAGRKVSLGTLFCEVQDNFKAYAIGTHRHTPEIEQELSLAAGKDISLTFVPHLLPVNRGILCTIYCKAAKKNLTPEEVRQVYLTQYAASPFIRILPDGTAPELKNVRGTMFCDIAFTVDKRNDRLILTVAIDNLCRGASGQAIANANLMTGLPLDTGLTLLPLIP